MKFFCAGDLHLFVRLQLNSNMSDDLRDEIDAINAIFPNSVEAVDDFVYCIGVSDRPDLRLQIRFPKSYPDEIPSILRVILLNPIKYPDPAYLQVHFREILERVFNSGLVCLFDLQIEIAEFLDRYDAEHVPAETTQKNEPPERIDIAPPPRESGTDLKPVTQVDEPTDHLSGWTQSDPISDRGSTFVAFTRSVSSVEQAQEYLDTLVNDRKIARSSHNMTAWRIRLENGVQFQDYDDDGESAAGSRLLHLLTVCSISRVMSGIVCVTNLYSR